MTRLPAVADRFYPGTNKALTKAMQELLPAAGKVEKTEALAVVSPHAGYIYSGGVAGETLGAVVIPETVVILGPNHHGQGLPVALSTTTWTMPTGDVPIDIDFAERVVAGDSPIQKDEIAHRFEHSLEVQVPFLQAQQPNLSLVPIVLSHLSYSLCEEVGNKLAATIIETGKNVLIVASSDMSHYETREEATKKDSRALAKIEQLDPQGLYETVHDQRISMCGVVPVTVALIAAKILGATSARIVRYTDSGEISGDTDQVVGYAGIVIS